MSNDTSPTPVNMEGTITFFRASDKAKDNAFGTLVRHVTDNKVTSKKELAIFAEPHELAYMDKYYFNHVLLPDGTIEEHDASKLYPSGIKYCLRKGKYNLRYFLPNAYTSAKSVIGNALDAGIPLEEEGKVKGKSRLQQEINDWKKRNTKTTKSAMQNALDGVAKINKNWDLLTTEEKNEVKYKLKV